jgi:hypothetical protein
MLASFYANATDDLTLVDTGLVFQEKIMFKETKVWVHSKIGFTQMDQDGDLENQVRVQVD